MPFCGGTSGGDGEGHRERQRHQADRDAGDQVAGQGAGGVPLPEALNELWRGQRTEGHSGHCRRGDRVTLMIVYITIFEYMMITEAVMTR